MTAPRPGRLRLGAAVAAAATLLATLVATLLGSLVATLVAAPAASAIDSSHGTPGFCPDDDGVTVVVDFQQLGGETIVRCAPGTEPRTGLEVLADAGLQVEGVQRWGDGFVCRIEDRPSLTEQLAVVDDDGYRETCLDTPPQSAYWGYWRASNGADWEFSSLGANSATSAPGGFEGWSFSLDAGGDNPAPRIAPERPAGTEGVTGSEQSTTSRPEERGASARGGTATDPPPLPRERPGVGNGLATGPSIGPSTDPSPGRGADRDQARATPGWTGGEAAADIRDPAGGSAWSSLLGLGAVGAVAVVAAVVSLRCRRGSPPGPRA